MTGKGYGMFETIRKRYLTRYTFYTLLSWELLILIIVANRKDIGALITMYTKEAIDIYDLNESQLRDGIHVEGEIVTPLGIYAYQERGGEKREIQFFILAGQNQIIGIDCKGDVKDDLQRNQTAFEAAYSRKFLFSFGGHQREKYEKPDRILGGIWRRGNRYAPDGRILLPGSCCVWASDR